MFALRVTYLTGRVYSAAFEDGDDKRETEWPPNPSRLYSALVAAWGEGGAEEELRPALRWLEERPAPPMVVYGDCWERALVRVYVPVNDSAGAEALPESRPRKARTFPSASLSDPNVYFVWEDSLPTNLRAPLEALLRRTSHLGHSSSLVAVEIADCVPDELQVLQPDGTGARRLRVAYPGQLEELERRFERFQENPAKVHRPGTGRTQLYSSRGTTASQEPARGVFGDMFVLRRVKGVSLPLKGGLQLAAALRGAMIKLAPQPCPEAISGHAPESTPENPVRSEKPHVALVPLAFVGSRHATGALLGIAALLPGTLSREERNTCIGTLHRVREITMACGAWQVEPATSEVTQSTLRPEAWTGPSRVWATVTPFVFDSYPRDPYGDEAQEVVRRAVERIGLPRPVSVALTKVSPHVGVPPAPGFPPALSRNGKPRRFHQHALLVFAEPVAGPVVAGAGRYYGYGFFRPLAE